MNPAFFHNIGAFLKAVIVAAGTATAGGAGDNSKVTGQTINRDGYLSGKLAVPFKAVLTQAATISFAVEIQESADGSAWDNAVALQALTVAATGGAGGSTEYGTVEINDDLTGRKKYVRYNITPDLSAANTDTVNWGATFVKGGALTVPAT